MRPRAGVLAAVGMAAGLLLMSSCGEDSSSTADDTSSDASTSASSDSGWPGCSDVWVDGGTIPKGYEGCVADDGTEVKADKQTCSSGQVLVTYDDSGYGVVGGPVNLTDSLKTDSGYKGARQACLA